MSQNNSDIAITKAPLHSEKKRARAISSAPLKPPDDPSQPQNNMSQDASDTTTATTAQLHQINIDFNPCPALSPGGEFIENVTDCTQAVSLTVKNSSSTVNYKLNALLSHANNFFSAELAAVLELCNELSVILDLILCTYKNSLPHQTAVLRQAMGHRELAAVLELCNELSVILDLILCTYKNSLPHQTAVLRQAMGHRELAAVLELCNELSVILDLILCTYKNSLPHQTAVLRQAMGHRELAAVLELCNELSVILDLILCTYKNSLPHQTAALRQAMGHSIVKAIKDLTAESKPTLIYATAVTAKVILSNNFFQTVSMIGQSHKKQTFKLFINKYMS
ncbi:hypothetical protein ACO22_06511 [Paracoccidioides brasiliensis]|uniref:Uncharacterized protein n=1 Tax=Paracoccidioides brasiliensis TaxID=121759 RepID=A0A1D2J797_PARBR|nr:hypothetical protein ACO22_06511 [Paracoccidioides brasiliensis]